jgi:hypothetical protein
MKRLTVFLMALSGAAAFGGRVSAQHHGYGSAGIQMGFYRGPGTFGVQSGFYRSPAAGHGAPGGFGVQMGFYRTPAAAPAGCFGSTGFAAPSYGFAAPVYGPVASPGFSFAPVAPSFGFAVAAPSFGFAPAAPSFSFAPAAAPNFGFAATTPSYGFVPAAAPGFSFGGAQPQMGFLGGMAAGGSIIDFIRGLVQVRDEIDRLRGGSGGDVATKADLAKLEERLNSMQKKVDSITGAEDLATRLSKIETDVKTLGNIGPEGIKEILTRLKKLEDKVKP